MNEIIKRLGYSDTPFLKLNVNGAYDTAGLNAQTTKILNSLAPYATYIVNNEPFVVFFDEPINSDMQKDVHKKIWNAQIPIAIFCGTATMKIFCGYTIDTESHLLTLAKDFSFSNISNIDDSSPFSFWEITNQNFWKTYTPSFRGKKLSEELLGNLSSFARRLENIHNISFATKLVLRFIFIRYLVDRGVNLDYHGFSSDVAESKEALLALLSDKSNLYALFRHLKDRFNGNLFEIEDYEIDVITDAVLNDIDEFLSARIVSDSGQLSLFDLYDFAIIPVELISNIFEILLGEETQIESNAFYTPKYLVDYILDMTIKEHIEKNDNCKILDPSCGSGIFLVDSYRRMVEKRLGGKRFAADDEDDLLCSILKDNIYGVDINSHAVDVAIFSLYLAVLDYKDPKTLKEFRLPNLKGDTLIVCDFFDKDALSWLERIPFDFIIGNPPWSNKPGTHADYCREYGYKHLLYKNDTCRSFVLRSKDFCLNKNAKCCFVLKSRILYTQGKASKSFRQFLLTRTKISHLVELSSVRTLVFEGADAPAMVLSYVFSDDNMQENRFEYTSMKRNVFFELLKIIVVEKTDVKSVQQKLLMENDWAWKTLVYGLAGDFDIISKLKLNTKTLGERIKNQNPTIVEGVGVKYNDGARRDASHLFERWLLDSSTSTISHFFLDERNKTRFLKPYIDAPRKEALFCAPYCLVKTGLDLSDYTMRAVYSETDFVFHETVYAIKGAFSQKSFLLAIVGLLNSKIYAYFNLMLGSFLGIEREKRIKKEILSFPAEINDDIAAQVERIQEIKNQYDVFGANTDASAEIEALNQTIFGVFGLLGNEFVDYALQIQIPQLTRKDNKDAMRDANEQDFEAYAKYFYNYLCPIFESAKKYVQIYIYPTIVRHYSAVEVFILDVQPTKWLIVTDDKTNRVKTMLTELSSHKTNEKFYFLKDVICFDENSFCIIKPNGYKNWHPAIAKLDIMEVTDQILSRNGVEN
ncbi:MAG: N-6 DNA methylase [Defluviitaleaceae bacterium]|nr:N-6 DNA methylase [Defluviitaleaceae bacterium]